jgi:hypothetical protein
VGASEDWPEGLVSLFSRADEDKDGRLTAAEITALAKGAWNTTLSDNDTIMIFDLLDSDGDGSITRIEFADELPSAVEGGLGSLLVGCYDDPDPKACFDKVCDAYDECWKIPLSDALAG